MEEYEPYIEGGRVIFSGVDYEAIVLEAEKEADIILWGGGNNDTPFNKPDLEIVVVDPHLLYFPGQVNFLRADVIVCNKVDSASKENIEQLENNDLKPAKLLIPDLLQLAVLQRHLKSIIIKINKPPMMIFS